jgi:hypothetical protein
MSAQDYIILRSIERKIEKEGLEISKIDILVNHGHVTLTGFFIYRANHKVMQGYETRRFRDDLMRIPGVNDIVFHTLTDSATI